MILRFWHHFTRHHWKEETRKFHPPLHNLTFVACGFDQHAAERGYTELFFDCSCGMVRVDRRIGDHTAPAIDPELAELRQAAGV